MPLVKLFSVVTLATPTLCQHRRMVPAPFNATPYRQLMDCVRNASPRCDIAIQRSGTIAIVPPEGERIDLDSPADAGLDDCLERFTSFLDLNVHYDRTYVEHGDAVTATQEHATPEWAEANGARGVMLQNVTESLARGVEVGASEPMTFGSFMHDPVAKESSG